MGNRLTRIAVVVVFALMINMNIALGGQEVDNKTRVTINNHISGPVYNPELIYTIQTPKIIDYQFILAIDSSGSIEDELGQKNAILKAVPDFIRAIPEIYPEANFNISIVSWDDDVDFAYDAYKGYNNNETAILAELNNDSVSDISNNFRISTLETELTDFSTPIKTSLDILNLELNQPNDLHKYRRFIILVSGNGEFKPANEELIKRIKEKKYPIYFIGMDLKKEPSEIRKHVKLLTENNKNQSILISGGDDLYPPLNESLEEALKSHLENATRAPLAYNVKIRETLYCYYNLDSNSVKLNGVKIDPSLIRTTPNGDGTNTIEIEIPGGLYPNSDSVVTLNARFDPGYLPVTLAKDRRQIILCSPNPDTKTGRFFFNWFTGEYRELTLNGV